MSSATEEFLEKLRVSLHTGTFVKLTLSQPKFSVSSEAPRNVYGRLVTLKEGPRLSVLSRFATRDVTKNHPVADALAVLGPLVTSTFECANLFTTTGDWQLRATRNRPAILKASRPAFTVVPAGDHDQSKSHPVPAQSAFLQELGITNAQGQPRPGMADKLRQIQRFVEILGHHLDESGLRDAKALTVVDMGCGKASLTFATYQYLEGRGIRPTVTGIELRPDLVSLTNAAAKKVGFAGLQFIQGSIGEVGDAPLPATVDILIALHACDTATDDALFQAIRLGASLILVAPCCHKELRPQIRAPEVMAGQLKHGILLERQAEALTDAIRAQLLEMHGYKATVFEFISPEHTGKNVMIAAVKRAQPLAPEPIRESLRQLMDFFGIRHQHLAELLGKGDIDFNRRNGEKAENGGMELT